MFSDIYVDLDDVLGETSLMFLGLLKKEFGRDVAYNDLTSFSLAMSLGLNAEALAEFVRLAHTRDQLMSIVPVVGASDVLHHWHGRGVRISIVTGRPPDTQEISCEWLRATKIPYDRVLFVDKYRRSVGSGLPLISLEDVPQMAFCLVIEDSLEVATYLSTRMGVPIVLKTCPWNMGEIDSTKLWRCNSWREIAETFDAFISMVATFTK
jgi:uncharacterized HAD superfamily protein